MLYISRYKAAQVCSLAVWSKCKTIFTTLTSRGITCQNRVEEAHRLEEGIAHQEEVLGTRLVTVYRLPSSQKSFSSAAPNTLEARQAAYSIIRLRHVVVL